MKNMILLFCKGEGRISLVIKTLVILSSCNTGMQHYGIHIVQMEIYNWSLIKGAIYQVPSEVRRNSCASAYRKKKTLQLTVKIDSFHVT